MVKRAVLLVVGWYLFLCAFYSGYFWGVSLPEISNQFLLLAIVPYLGFGALIWSTIYYGFGMLVVGLGLVSSVIYLRTGSIRYWSSIVALEGLSGAIFLVVGH